LGKLTVRASEPDGVPAGLELQFGMLWLTGEVAPLQFDTHRLICIDASKSEVNVWTATTRVAAAAVDLANEFAAVREANERLGAECRTTNCVTARMPGAFEQRRVCGISQGKQQVQSEKCPGPW
jgi:hypothetical protein